MKEEVKEEEKEVIKEEVLNSAPNVSLGSDISGKDEWSKLKDGQEFLDWYNKNKKNIFKN